MNDFQKFRGRTSWKLGFHVGLYETHRPDLPRPRLKFSTGPAKIFETKFKLELYDKLNIDLSPIKGFKDNQEIVCLS